VKAINKTLCSLLALACISCGPPPKDTEIKFLYKIEGMGFSVVEYSELNSGTWSSATGSLEIEFNDSFNALSLDSSSFADTNFFVCNISYEASISEQAQDDGTLTLGDPYPRVDNPEDEAPVKKVFKSISIDTDTLNVQPSDCDINPQTDTTWHFELFQNGDLIITNFGRNIEYFLRPTREANNEIRE
jgi:hypothetical protein